MAQRYASAKQGKRRVVSCSASLGAEPDCTYLVDTTSADVNVILPDVVVAMGSMVEVKMVAGTHNVIVSNSDNIDGQPDLTLNSLNQSYTFRSTGTTWHIM